MQPNLTTPHFHGRTFNPHMQTVRLFGSLMIGIGVFLSGFVLNEPAPYEIFMAGLIGVWFVLGLKISRHIFPLLILLLVFNVGGLLSATQMSNYGVGFMYVAVSTFLALSSVFFAAVIDQDMKRLSLIFRAYLLAALLASLFGILGYFNLIPGGEVFTLYSRARGTFEDPNVFSPFLILPAIHLIYSLLTGSIQKAPLRVVALLILTIGIFLSFSRAAWGLYIFCAILLTSCMLIKTRSNKLKVKIVIVSLIGLGLLTVAIAIALQFDQVSEIFTNRARLVQDYDSARYGRFERHWLGLLMAFENPLGIGPLVFGPIYGEDTHNIFLKALLDYGWLGFTSYMLMITITFAFGFRYLFRDRPWQPYLMCAYIVLVGHTLIGMVIDTDHWRHFYLLLGIVWGCIALEMRHGRRAAY